MATRQQQSELFQYAQLLEIYGTDILEQLIVNLVNVFDRYDDILLEEASTIRFSDRAIQFALLILILLENQNTKYIHEHDFASGYKHGDYDE